LGYKGDKFKGKWLKRMQAMRNTRKLEIGIRLKSMIKSM
jgi:hypothetical protein